jgi:ABC-type uncharacterized transport system substrate-binding protein
MNTSFRYHRLAFSCAAFILFASAGLFAHPHMFLTSREEFVWDKANLSGCWLEWTFDQFFSADLMNYDANHDGKFSPTETKKVYDGAFINLKNYYYFLFIRQGKTRTNPKGVSEFSVSQKNSAVTYRFFIDLSKSAPGEICLAVYDYTFFCDIRPAPDPVKLTYDPEFIKPTFAIVENKDYPVYYNPLGAIDDTTIYYTWKKGLQTYYPKEIRITYEN